MKGTNTSGATSNASRADLTTVPKNIPIILPNKASTIAPPTNKSTEAEKSSGVWIEASNIINDCDVQRGKKCQKRDFNRQFGEVVRPNAVKSRVVLFCEGFSFRGNFLAHRQARSS